MSKLPGRRPTLALAVVAAIAPVVALSLAPAASAQLALPKEIAESLDWRSIGPATISGRITDLAVHEADSTTWWAATASGGLLKTTNDGRTFEHQFQREAVASIGDVCVAPSDANVVWVGTGENNPRNSVSWGNGVYKSVDGGGTWKHMGLKDSFQIGRIQIHPTDPNVVYVAALGRLWGPSDERGLYKTTDGGETWTRILFVDERTGCIDVQLKPDDPETILAATYERERDLFDTNDPSKRWGPGGGLWRSTDGGAAFVRVTEGLPSCNLGRIGLDWYRADPNVVFACIESERIGREPDDAPYMGVQGEDVEVGARLTSVNEESGAHAAGLRAGDIVVALGDEPVLSWDDLQRVIRKHVAGETVKVAYVRDRKRSETDVSLDRRPEAREDDPAARRRGGGGGGRDNPFGTSLGGQVANVQDRQGPEGHEFGGLYRSADAGVTWTRVNSLNDRPMYFSQVRVDPSDETHIYMLGVPLFQSHDGGKTFTDDGGRDDVHVDHHAMWIDPTDGRRMILGNDGGIYITRDRMQRWDHLNHVAIGQFYHATVDPRRNYRVYGGLQDNGSWGAATISRTGEILNEDWQMLGWGDGFVCRVDPEDPDLVYWESQNGGMGRVNLRTGERGSIRPRAPRGVRYRFNWKTPYVLSNHNSRIFYAAGNYVFRSLDRGNDLVAISPEITNSQRGSATALAESVRDPNLLYVGTDDGAFWVTRNGGGSWENLLPFPFDDAPERPESGGDAVATPAPPAPPGGRGGFGGRGGRGGEGGGAGGPGGPGGPGGFGGGEGGGPAGGRRGGGRGLTAILEADANGDGRIEREEVPAMMRGFFDRVDGNGDGVLDADEIAAIRSRAAAGRGGAGGGAGGERAEGAAPPPARSGARPAAAPADPISGTWNGTATLPGDTGDSQPFTLVLKLGEDFVVTGSTTGPEGEHVLRRGVWDPERREVHFEVEVGEGLLLAVMLTLDQGALQGVAKLPNDAGEIALRATRAPGETGAPPRAARAARPEAPAPAPTPAPESESAPAAAHADAVSGAWEIVLSGPMGERTLSLDLKLGEDGSTVTGTMATDMMGGEMEEVPLASGSFDASSRKLTLGISMGPMESTLAAVLTGDELEGTISVGDGRFELEVKGRRAAPAGAAAPEAPANEQTLASLVDKPMNVSSIETSRFEAERVYATFDGHRSNDDRPHLFASEDGGRTWRSLRGNLPDEAGSARALREDVINPNLLYLGTEFGLWMSLDRGVTWSRAHGDLPTVAVHDIAIHPTRGEIVAATHGRSLWVLDVSAIRQMTEEAMREPVALFRPNDAIYWRTEGQRGGTNRRFAGENPDGDARIAYRIGTRVRRAAIEIRDAAGELVWETEGPTDEGVHVVEWNLRRAVPANAGGGRGGRGGFGRGGPRVPPGTYRVILEADGRTLSTTLVVEGDPDHPDAVLWGVEYDEMLELMEAEED